MKYGLVFLAVIASLGLSSCQTLSRTMQVPGNMMQSIGRSAGLASYEEESADIFCDVTSVPEFD